MKKLLLLIMLFFSFVGFSQLAEDFENPTFPPTGWVEFDNGIGTVQSWQRTTVSSLTYNASAGAAYVIRENVTDGTFAEDWLVTSQVLVPTDGQLRFQTRKAVGTNNGTQYTVRIATASQNNPADFTVLQTWDDSNINSNQTAPFYEQKVIDLTAYVGQNVYIAFVMTNDNGNRWLVDNVFVDQRCLESTNLFVTAINDTSVDLNWDNPSGATQWEIEWGPTGFTPGTGTTVVVNSNPYTLGGLTAATTYDYYVRPICPNENYGIWSDPETFTTAVCAIAQQCDFDFVMTDSFGDGWNGASMTISQFGVTVATIGSTFTGGSGPITVTVPLCSSQPFDLVWTAGGGYPNEVGVSIVDPLGATIFTMPSGSGSQAGTTIYSGVAACTPPTCPKPSNVIVSGVNTSSGTITWSDNTSGCAVEWNVIIQPAGTGYPTASTPITATVTSTSYSFSGLNSDTEYEVYVQANCTCSGPDPSFWEGPTDFSTTKDYCNGDLFTDFGGITGNYGNNEDITWTICPDNPGDVVSVFFNSFNTEANWDGLYVYNGPSTASPQIASANGAGNVPGGVPGSYWGTTIPGPFVSTDPSGCLTFRFRSDGGGTFSGWDANVTCGPAPTCSMPTNLQIVSTSTSTITLGWDENNTPPATNWQIVQQAIGDGYPGGGATIINANTNPFTLPAPAGPVEYYVRTDCGGGDFSYWTGPLTYIAGDDWEVAVPICSFDDYTGTTLSSYNDETEWPNPWPELSTAFCGSIENDSFFVFEATGTSINMNVNVACASGTGVQFMIFDAATMGSGPVNEINCYSPMNVGNNALTFTGLTPGNTYYLMIDGYAGAVCDYTISLPDGSTTTSVNIIQDSQEICIGQSIVLDAEGGNANYTWSPSVGLNATTGNQVTFTPPTPGVYTISLTTTQTSIVCDTSDAIVITVYDNAVPSFANPGPLCQSVANVPLDTTDVNGISGTWTLLGNPVTEVDTATIGIYDYIFTPDPTAHPCSPAITMQVEIRDACTFGSFATALNINNCQTTNPGEFFNISGSGTNLIGPSTNIYTNNDFGTYLQNSGNLILNGAELRSFKTASSNVCQVNMYYRIYESSTTPGAFNTVSLPLYDTCVTGTFPTGGTCNNNDQKWQNIAQNIDLTQNAPGDYLIEVYFELIGDNDSPTACDGDIELLNNAGNNYFANFTIQGALTFSQNDEQCGSANGSITISGFVPGDTYTVTYNDDGTPIAAVDYQADFNGEITIINLNAGTYDNFNFVINGCSIFEAAPIVLVDYSPSITNVTSNSPICFGEDAIFIVQGTPNFDVDYTINGTPMSPATIDATGFATITVTAPAVGTVDFALLNIHNTVCNIVATNTSSVIVNPLPTATISAPSQFTCIGSDAVFVITGTPGAIVTFTGAPGSPITLDASGSYTLNVSSTVDVQVTLVDVTNSATGCSNGIAGQVANVAIVTVPVATVNTTQPSCSVTTGTIEVTSPLISQINFPGNLFISEVVDANGANLNYVEIYNGTGASVDLSNYKLKVEANSNCEVILSGTLANDNVVVVKCGTGTPIAGVAYDFQFTSCTASVNNNDRFLITDLSDVVIDQWGPSPTDSNLPNAAGYRYARIETGTVLPSITWDPADWNYTDWATVANDDYSDLGIYSLYAANYEYTLSDGTTSTTQTTTTFSGVNPGNYTIVVHDTATDCYSQPLDIVINTPPGAITPSFDQIGPLCQNSTAPSLPSGSTNGVTGTWSPSTIDTSVVGTVTYTFTPDASFCALIVTMDIEILQQMTPTFTQIGPLCQNSTAPSLPSTSDNGIDGTWSPSTIDTSVSGTSTYTFTPTSSCHVVVTMDITITPQLTPVFDQIGPLCQNSSAPTLSSTSNNGVTGSWSPSVIDTSVVGTVTYTFTPSTPCDVQITMDITINAESQLMFSPLTLCVGDNINNIFPSTSGITGTWSDSTIDTSIAGNYTYTFTPDPGQCYIASNLDVFVITKTPVTFNSVEVCNGASLDFPAISTEGYVLTGSWSPSSISTSAIGNVEYTFTPNDICYETTTFTVITNGCTIQKGISPNGDYKNDNFDLSSYNVSKLEIFNRYGRKVYEKGNYVDEWYGQADNGNELPTGTYYYVIEFSDLPSKTGWIYINRQE